MFAGAARSLRSGQFRFNPISARNGGHQSLSSAVRGPYWQALCLSLSTLDFHKALPKTAASRRFLNGLNSLLRAQIRKRAQAAEIVRHVLAAGNRQAEGKGAVRRLPRET
jgi:hypothetical protein